MEPGESTERPASTAPVWPLPAFVALIIAITTTAQAKWYGLGLGRSAFVGLEAAVAGTVVWSVYHAITRRRDGIAAFGLPSLIVLQGARGHGTPPFWGALLSGLFVIVPTAFYVRAHFRKVAKAHAAKP